MILRTLSLGAALAVALAPAAIVAAPNWLATVATTGNNSHVLGNPNAKVKLTEFVSYTCPHCAHFEVESDAQLKLVAVAQGNVSIEVRHFLRDPADLAAALLTNCGPKEKFFANHGMVMRNQARWIQPMTRPSAQMRQRWSVADFGTRMRNIAKDLSFYPMFQARGYTVAQIDKCLADKAMATRLSNQAEADAKTYNIEGTPSFAINGERLYDTANWAMLAPQIRARL